MQNVHHNTNHRIEVHLFVHQSFRYLGSLLEMNIIWNKDIDVDLFEDLPKITYLDPDGVIKMLFSIIFLTDVLDCLPSAVPWTRRYCTDLKFLALSVTVEFWKVLTKFSTFCEIISDRIFCISLFL